MGFEPLALVVLCLIMSFFSREIVNLAYGLDYEKYSDILSFLSVWMLFGVVNNILGIQFLVASGRANIYNKCFAVSAIFSIIVFFSFAKKFSYYGIVAGMLGGEVLLTIFIGYVVMDVWKKYKLQYLKV